MLRTAKRDADDLSLLRCGLYGGVAICEAQLCCAPSSLQICQKRTKDTYEFATVVCKTKSEITDYHLARCANRRSDLSLKVLGQSCLLFLVSGLQMLLRRHFHSLELLLLSLFVDLGVDKLFVASELFGHVTFGG